MKQALTPGLDSIRSEALFDLVRYFAVKVRLNAVRSRPECVARRRRCLGRRGSVSFVAASLDGHVIAAAPAQRARSTERAWSIPFGNAPGSVRDPRRGGGADDGTTVAVSD